MNEKNAKFVVVDDYGSYDATTHVVALWKKARLTKHGQVDRRTKAGREFARMERRLLQARDPEMKKEATV